MHLEGLEKNLLNHEVRTSYEDFDRLLADDFVEFGSSGRVFDKREQLEATNASDEVLVMHLTDFHLNRLAEDVAHVTFKVYKENNNQYSLRSSIWKLNEDRWQMFFHQGTNIV
ncbi:DUF4440 domain-containing protein [Halalkalibacillus sediminis]|uniref:DUF4440 domain-containing protein n=1 Tax=Halalkalibacillus sediminis TaxID=2018042 RepID=A0A2I0QTV8_9BACI|nr:DUF4440 domain-containing protein [Halalkalibacillus sediminis]